MENTTIEKSNPNYSELGIKIIGIRDIIIPKYLRPNDLLFI